MMTLDHHCSSRTKISFGKGCSGALVIGTTVMDFLSGVFKITLELRMSLSNVMPEAKAITNL